MAKKVKNTSNRNRYIRIPTMRPWKPPKSGKRKFILNVEPQLPNIKQRLVVERTKNQPHDISIKFEQKYVKDAPAPSYLGWHETDFLGGVDLTHEQAEWAVKSVRQILNLMLAERIRKDLRKP